MKVSKGKIKKPHLVLVYGPEGMGKSTFGADAPDALFIGAESGSSNLDTSRVEDIKTHEDVVKSIDYLLNNVTEYKSVVLDSLDWLEPLFCAHLLKKHNVTVLEEIGGGFGKYKGILIGEWRMFIDKLTQLRDVKKMNVVLIAHSHLKAFNDPNALQPYDRHSLKLSEAASALFREYVDVVLFFNKESHTKKEKNMTKARAFSDDQIYAYTTKTVSHDAKNRFGLPPKIKLNLPHPFADFEALVKGSSTTELANLKLEITEKVLDVTDKALLPKIEEAIKNAGDSYGQLSAIRDRLIEITTEKV